MFNNTNDTYSISNSVIDFAYFINISIFICCFFKYFKHKMEVNQNNYEEQEQNEVQETINTNAEVNIGALSENEINEVLIKECSICLDDFKQGENIIKLNCNHIFHYACINEWILIKPECPECRRDIFVV